jgi:hypothetical protein
MQESTANLQACSHTEEQTLKLVKCSYRLKDSRLLAQDGKLWGDLKRLSSQRYEKEQRQFGERVS